MRNPWHRVLALYLHVAARKQPQHFVKPNPERFAAWVASEALVTRATPATMLAPGVDYVGRFEQLDQSMSELGELLGIDLADKLTHENARPQTLGRISIEPCDWYDATTRRFVADLGAWEIERFGYTFG